jgi:hypothetical protein
MSVFVKLRYDVTEIPLADLVRRILGVADLAALPPTDQVATRETDQHTSYHDRFYRGVHAILPAYRRLVGQVLGDDADEVYVQRVPTFRVHLRGSKAVGSWHRDLDFGHDPAETNYWVPLTRAFGNNTLWIEGEEVVADYGDVVMFDGANSWHGNRVNDTPLSRVSLDFRTIPQTAYRPRQDRTVSAGLRFAIGEYWDVL